MMKKRGKWLCLIVVFCFLFAGCGQRSNEVLSGEELMGNYKKAGQTEETVYQKLADGEPVRIAVLGDSIGFGIGTETENTWGYLLYYALAGEYGSLVTLDNLSIGGTTSYTGYYQFMRKLYDEPGTVYDLVIICYGHNDMPEDFALLYESILRSVKRHDPSCQIITILESSQREYTDKIRTIQDLSDRYGADVADTIEAFAASGQPYESLTDDGTHPNAEGYQLYFETIRQVIDRNVDQDKGAVPLPEPLDEKVRLFDECSFIAAEECAVEDGIYRFDTERPVLGIVVDRSVRGGDYVIKVDGTVRWDDSTKTENEYNWVNAVLIDRAVPSEAEVSAEFPEAGTEGSFLGFLTSGETVG